ncbi:MAG TPA: ABC transporter ATP-binding protein [Amycolatopsis sp.]|nr:ABC transporter ATP-binding protein [Amycolatopsis sp.]
MTSVRLEARGMTVSYGGLVANGAVDLRVHCGQFVGLIGPNGAGKSTFIDAVSGFVAPDEGSILLDGADITAMSAHSRARHGMSRTFQAVELFDDLPVIENLLVAAERPRWWSLLADLVRPGKAAAGIEAAERALRRVGIESARDLAPHELSHGQRKLVGVARALAASPKILLLDEPAAGLDTTEVGEFAARLRGLIDDDLSILLVDHNMGLVLNTCDYVYVLDFGCVIAHGPPEEIRGNPDVIAAYLGTAAGAAGLDDDAAGRQVEGR